MTSLLAHLARIFPKAALDDLADSRVAAGCSGKERHDTPQVAYRVRSKRARTYKPGQQYHCPHCGGFHIGRNKGGRR